MRLQTYLHPRNLIQLDQVAADVNCVPQLIRIQFEDTFFPLNPSARVRRSLVCQCFVNMSLRHTEHVMRISPTA